jgi:hypothetical protein
MRLAICQPHFCYREARKIGGQGGYRNEIELYDIIYPYIIVAKCANSLGLPG